jgi:hypothetical protein
VNTPAAIAPGASDRAITLALACGLASTALLAVAAAASDAPDATRAAAPAASAPSSEPTFEPSPAEQLVFLHPHLASTPPGTLRYAWTDQHEGAAPTADQASLALRPDADGHCCTVHADYLSGPAAVSLPDIDLAKANPIVLYFLEGEVRLLERTTKGPSAHFRRRLRQALADEATVTPTTVRWDGRDVPAQVVHVAPFLADPFRDRFAHDAPLEYDLVFSDAVPGGVWRLSATLPAATPGAAPLARRQLTLEASSPATASTTTR